MVTIFRAEGLRVVIFANDHEPAHVHVFGDGHAKINLAGIGGVPELVWTEGMKRSEARRAMKIVSQNRAQFLERWKRSMAELSDAEITAAARRGKLVRANEPRAVAARFDHRRRLIKVDLNNGCTFSFPPELAQGLEAGSDSQLAAVEIIGGGYGLHWEALDADLSVVGLLAGLFGTQAYMARRAGQTSSPAKIAAARLNGAKGGRPRKTARS